MNQDKKTQKQSLLAWINEVLGHSFRDYSLLCDGTYYSQLLKLIEDFEISELNVTEQSSWSVVLSNLKKISRHLAQYYKKHLPNEFDPQFVNLLEMAQHQDENEAFKFGLQVFCACVQAPNNNRFVSPILNLPTDYQLSLMNVIQNHRFHQKPVSAPKSIGSLKNIEESAAPQSSINQSIHHNDQLRELLEKVEAQQLDIEKLEGRIEADKIKKMELQKRVKALEDQNDKLNEQIQNNLEELNNFKERKGDSLILQKAVAEEASQSIIEELKQRLYQESEAHLKKVGELNETIDFLKEKLEKITKQSAAQLQQSALEKSPSRITSPSYPEHPPCISLKKHQQLLLAQTEKIKELTKNQWEHNLEIQKLNNKIGEQNREISKLKEEITRKGDLVNRKDYDSLKVDVLSMLRDKFKADFEAIKNNSSSKV